MKLLIVSDTHGRDANLEAAVLREQPFDMLFHCGDVEGREFYIEALAECVFFGHTHKPVIDEEDGIMVLNPGSLTFPRQNGHKPSYAVVEADEDGGLSAEIRYL